MTVIWFIWALVELFLPEQKKMDPGLKALSLIVAILCDFTIGYVLVGQGVI